MGYEFKNWKRFRDQMKNENIRVSKFEFKYHDCDFDIVYSLEQNVFYAAKKGTQIAFSIYLDWYKASVILDKEPYRQLIECKNSAYNHNKPYSPIDFLKLLDDKLGTNFIIVKASDNDYFTITKKAIPDEEKIYFLSFRPYAAKKGTQIAFSIYLDWYKASVILDKEPYRQLIECKNSAYNHNKPYSPIDFLKLLDDKLGTNFIIVKASDNDYFTITKKAIPDEEKIYFLSFRPHTSGKRHVTGTNLAKTRKILGHQIAEFCKSNDVSVAFTNRPSEKSFEMIKNPKKVLDEQND